MFIANICILSFFALPQWLVRNLFETIQPHIKCDSLGSLTRCCTAKINRELRQGNTGLVGGTRTAGVGTQYI